MKINLFKCRIKVTYNVHTEIHAILSKFSPKKKHKLDLPKRNFDNFVGHKCCSFLDVEIVHFSTTAGISTWLRFRSWPVGGKTASSLTPLRARLFKTAVVYYFQKHKIFLSD